MRRTHVKGDTVNKGDVTARFVGKNLTVVGGIGLFYRFIRALGVEEALEREVELPRKAGKYGTGRALLSLVYAQVLDLRRQSDTILLRLDKVFHKLVGFDDYPHQSTFSRLLEKFTVPVAMRIGEVNVGLTMKARNNLEGYQGVTLDMDSHVSTVYGKQQRAKVGYNPKKPGRKSYHPVLCFIGETRDFLWGKFRPGNRYSGHGAKEFLRECLSKLPRAIVWIKVRADSGFFSDRFLSYLEKKVMEYVVAAKLYEPIQYLLGGLEYRDIGGGVSVGEFRYRGNWDKERRMVVVREEIREGKEHKKVPRLFELQGYSYQVIVTNLDWEPEEVWRFYNGRANVENLVKEGVLGYGLDVTLSHHYGGNVAHFFLVMLAYNLMNWFKEKALGQTEVKRMAKWIRGRFFFVAGKLVRRGRRWILNLPDSWPWREEYQQAEQRLAALRFG